jgi:hypothetical protein
MYSWVKRFLGYSDILVLGAAHLDTVVDTREPLHDVRDKDGTLVESFVGYGAGEIRKSVGGSAYNIAINIAKPPHGRWRKNSTNLFTFLPSKNEIANLIVRKLKIAGVGVKYVNRIRTVTIAGGEQQIPHLGNFVAMRYNKNNGSSSKISLARSSSIFRGGTDLLDEDGAAQLSAAVKKTKVLVLDSDTDASFAVQALNVAQAAECPLFVSVMSVDALESYVSSLTSTTRSLETSPDAVCVGVRAPALLNWLDTVKRTNNPILPSAQIAELAAIAQGAVAEGALHKQACIAICTALNTDNVLICDGLTFNILSYNGSTRSVTVSPQAAVRNWMGASDAALAAVIDVFARRLKGKDIAEVGHESSLIGLPEHDVEIKKTITVFVLGVLNATGATYLSS